MRIDLPNLVGKTIVTGSLEITGSVQPGTTNSFALGASNNFWSTVFATNLTGSLTKLSDGTSYLVGGTGVTVTTGSNGAVTISFGSINYATASFTNATAVTVNHTVGLTLYDIEVFDTSYNKIIPMTATATSSTQANITFAIPTSGYVAVGGPTAGASGGSSVVTATTGSTPYYAARAWVNFDGTGTIAIRASANVSSITDVGTGVYRVNFTTAMVDTSYSAIGIKQNVSTNSSCDFYDCFNTVGSAAARTTTGCSWQCIEGGNVVDSANINISIFR